MVGALKTPGIPARLAAYERTAMSTGIEEDPDDAVIAANNDQRSAGHTSRAEIARLGNFRFVPGINPAFTENASTFEFEIFGFGKSPPVNSENACLLIVDNQVVQRRILHVFSPPPSDRPIIRSRTKSGKAVPHVMTTPVLVARSAL
jgi:hypothetical protein